MRVWFGGSLSCFLRFIRQLRAITLDRGCFIRIRAMGLFLGRREFRVILTWEAKALNRMTIRPFGPFRDFRQEIIRQDFLLSLDPHATSDRTSPLFAHHCHYSFQGLPLSPLIIGAYRLRHGPGECSR